MIRYSDLTYTVPPWALAHSDSFVGRLTPYGGYQSSDGRSTLGADGIVRDCGGRAEYAYAITPDEVVRRITRRGVVTYETADLSSMSGEFEPEKRAPNVPRIAWVSVSGDEETPE